MEFGLRNLGNFYFWNPESGKCFLLEAEILGFVIRNIAQGIGNRTYRIRIPSSTDKDRNPVPGIRNTVIVKPRIQDCFGFPYMVRLHRHNNLISQKMVWHKQGRECQGIFKT